MEILRKKVLTLSMAAMLSTQAVAANGLSDILSSTSGGFDYAGPSSIKTQTRGYYNFGGAAVRSDMGGVIRPFHIEMLTIASGCGGVDIGFGGFSFLNLDQLVAKLQKIASAAPAFAFNMALSSLCKDCQAIMDQLNAIADAINGLNFDACKSAVGWCKSLGQALSKKLDTIDDAKSGIERVIGNVAQSVKDYTDSIQGFINCGPNGECSDQSSQAAKQKALEKLKFQGSLVRKIFKDNNTFAGSVTADSATTGTPYSYWLKGLTRADAEALFRAMIGDYYGYVDGEKCTSIDKDGGIEAYRVQAIAPLLSPEEVINMFLGGENTGFEDLAGYCQNDEVKVCGNHYGLPPKPIPCKLTSTMRISSLRSTITSRLNEIVDKMRNGSVKEDAKFISSLRYPVYRALNVATIHNDDLLIGYIADVVIAQEISGISLELTRKARDFVSLIRITESTVQLDDDGQRQIEARASLISEKANELIRDTSAKMEQRLGQIMVLEDSIKRLKNDLTRRGMYRLGY